MSAANDRNPEDFEITITRSHADDGAIVVFIDGTFGPDGGVPLRVIVNDDDAYAEIGHDANSSNEHPAKALKFSVTADQIAYVTEK